MNPPRRRKTENKDLPDNLYCMTVKGKVYYYWEHPHEHWRESMGGDRSKAITQAQRLNRMLMAQGINPRQRTPRPKGYTVSAVVDKCIPEAVREYRSEKSKKNTANHLKRIKEAGFASNSIQSVKILDLTEYLDTIDSAEMFNRQVYWLKYLFDFAIRRGILPLHYNNPAAVLIKRKTEEVKRKRLTYQLFNAIYAEASPALQLCMDIILHTTMRPGDVVKLKKKQFFDDKLHVKTNKSMKPIAIKLSASEQKSIISRSLQTGIASQFIVHHMPKRKGQKLSAEKEHPTQLSVEQLSTEFSGIRDQLGIHADLPAKQRASLYEVRSLAANIHEKIKGGTKADKEMLRKLMTHTSSDMTDHYIYSGRDEYEEVEACLDIKLYLALEEGK